MIWEYRLTSGNIWASFDYGEVEAETREEAVEKALEELEYNLSKANDAFNHCDITQGFSIDMDFTQIEVELKK